VTPNLNPSIVLGVGAHGDDLEAWAGAQIAKFVQDGADVYFLILTGGGAGTSESIPFPDTLIPRREAEQHEAANILGVKKVFFGGFTDGELENSPTVRKAIVRLIRELKPDLVLSWDPGFIDDPTLGIVNHPDHLAAGAATMRAISLDARNDHAFPKLLAEGLGQHMVTFLMMMSADGRTNYEFPISPKLREIKYQAVDAHASQPAAHAEAIAVDGTEIEGQPGVEKFRVLHFKR
jgi:LmbE family N-acetylglucosaminyl deacetylase